MKMEKGNMWPRFQDALAKTSRGGQSLFQHTQECLEAGLRLAHLFPDYPRDLLDTLIVGLCIHDVGKLDPGFQAMLRARIANEPLPMRKVKHESRTFNHDHIALVENSLEDIAAELKANFGHELKMDRLVGEGLEWAWACAATHHGMYYVSYEREENGAIRRQARRQWTSFAPLEVRRLTLVDLLFRFHPLGGLVIMADLIASYTFEKGLTLATSFSDATMLPEILENLLNHAQTIERSWQQYDPRDYGLHELLRLLAGNAMPVRQQ